MVRKISKGVKDQESIQSSTTPDLVFFLSSQIQNRLCFIIATNSHYCQLTVPKTDTKLAMFYHCYQSSLLLTHGTQIRYKTGYVLSLLPIATAVNSWYPSQIQNWLCFIIATIIHYCQLMVPKSDTKPTVLSFTTHEH